MSIINDALKKTQANFQNSQPPSDKTQTKMDTTPPQDSALKKPQPPEIPDMSKYIPQKEKTESASPAVSFPPKLETLKTQNENKEQTETAKSNPLKTFFSIVFIILFLAGAAVAFYINAPLLSGKKANKLTAVNVKREITKVAEAIPIPEVIKEAAKIEKKETYPPPPPPPGTLVVSGIVAMGSKQVALINNEIYEVGDIVDGKKILNISLDQVEIQAGDSKQTIKVEK